jgi:hypothetical protein
MKSKLFLVSLAVACLLIPLSAGASTVFETTGWITESTGLIFEFDADTAPFTYVATLSDLSEAPYFGFDFLYLSISTATDTVDSVVGPGSFSFLATPGETYFANVFGTPDGTTEAGAGLFGIEIKAVPIPPGLILLGTSVFGLILLRRRVR